MPTAAQTSAAPTTASAVPFCACSTPSRTPRCTASADSSPVTSSSVASSAASSSPGGEAGAGMCRAPSASWLQSLARAWECSRRSRSCSSRDTRASSRRRSHLPPTETPRRQQRTRQMRRHRRWTRLGHAWPRPRPQPQERRPRTESRRRLRCGRSGRTLRLCASRRSGCPPRPLPLLGARPCRGPRRPLRARPPSSCRVCVTLCRWVSLIPVASRVSVSSAPRHSHRVGCGHLEPCTVPWCVTRFAIFSLLISMCDIIHSTATRSSVRRTSVLAPRLGQSLAASRTKRQRFAG
mmetsp:Transcript_30560/g.101159  ORF Transcript_30560/g.101159 Transcript_30560/m.101159 type:complete len:294 (+) Transcript_30560:169-1050(+)